MAKLVIENMGWDKKRFDKVKDPLIKHIKKISGFLKLKTSVIIHFYPNKDKDDERRAEFDEGIILLYENSPDPVGDFTHELGHQILRPESYSVTLKAALNKLKRKLERNKGDKRVFIQEHTYSTICEVFVTLFKWYIRGKTMDKSYLDILNNFVPEGAAIVRRALIKEDLTKSRKDLLDEVIGTLVDSVCDSESDNKNVLKAREIIKSRIEAFGLSDYHNEIITDTVSEEIIRRKTKGRYSDLIKSMSGEQFGKSIETIYISNPAGIASEKDVRSFIKHNFSKPSKIKITFNAGIQEHIKGNLNVNR